MPPARWQRAPTAPTEAEMYRFIAQCGFLGLPLVVLSAVILGLIINQAVRLFVKKTRDSLGAQSALDAILFWGIMSAILGVLGQFSGMYNAARAVSQASAISPNIIAMGLAESLSTTLFGLTILVISSVAWFVLRNRRHALVRGGVS